MRMKVLWMCVIGAMVVASAPGQLITSVVRTNGQSGDRTPIGAFTGTTAPMPTQAGGLKDGNTIFSDRTFTWVNTPTGTLGPQNTPLIGSEYVRTFNSDKADGETDVTYAVTFSKSVTIWITVDDRFANEQTTVDSETNRFAAPGTFTDTGMDISTGNGDDNTLSIFAANFGPGTYVFGGSGGQ